MFKYPPVATPRVIALVPIVISTIAFAIIPDSTLGLSEVLYSGEAQRIFVGTPSITSLPNGTLLGSYEYFNGGTHPVCAFGPYQTKSRRAMSAGDLAYDLDIHFGGYPDSTTYVVASHDNGTTWTENPVSNISGIHFTALQQLPPLSIESSGVPPVAAVGTAPGGIRAALSRDGGLSWESQLVVNGTFDSGATPVVVHQGWVYRAVEARVGSGGWPVEFQAVMLRAQVLGGSYDSLLLPTSWQVTPPLKFQYPDWIPASWREQEWTKPGYLEGNAVVSPDGTTMYNILRVNSLPYANKGIILKYTPAPDGKGGTAGTLQYNSSIEFPGGMTKFTVRRLEGLAAGGGPLYITLSNNVTDLECPSMRDVLTVSTSPDLLEWTLHGVVLQDDSGLTAEDAHRYAGFHYVDFVAEVEGSGGAAVGDAATEGLEAKSLRAGAQGAGGGAESSGGASYRSSVVTLSYVVRTAYRGANSYHNSNRMTFKQLRLQVDSPVSTEGGEVIVVILED